jgi:hypothetical protein
MVIVLFSTVISAEDNLYKRGGTHKQIIERLDRLEKIMEVK